VTDRQIRLSYRAPLLKMAHVAVFRQITLGQARYLYHLGQLPRGELTSGALFLAERRFVVRALEFRKTLDPAAQKVFDAWQHGEIEMVEPRYDTELGVLPALPNLSDAVSTNRVNGR
jgi:hypothetical protein